MVLTTDWLPAQLLRDGWAATGEDIVIGVGIDFIGLVLLVGLVFAAIHLLRRYGNVPERDDLPELSYSELKPKAHAAYEKVFLWGPLRSIFFRNYEGDRIERYQPGQRLYYLAIAVAGLVLIASGLALLQEGALGSSPVFSWTVWHLLAAAVVIAGLAVHIAIAFTVGDFWGMAFTKPDWRRFVQSVKNFFGGDTDAPRFGKYSPPVKTLHWTNALLMFVLIISGIIMLRTITMPWWEAARTPFGLSESLVGLTYAIHGIAAGLWIGVGVLHVYFAAHNWEVSRSMLNGTLSRETFERYYDPTSWRPDNVDVLAEDGSGRDPNDDGTVTGADTNE